MSHLAWEFTGESGCPQLLPKILSKKFNEDVSDDRGYRCNFKIGSREDICYRPNYTLFCPIPERSNSPIRRFE
jgi:hypothetical protein